MSQGNFILKKIEVIFMERDIESTPQYIGLTECNSEHCCSGKTYVQKLKILFLAEAVANAVYTLNQCSTKALRLIIQRNVEWEAALRCTCVCLEPCICDDSRQKRTSLMRKEPNACFSGIVKVQWHIG